jgi:ABC-type Fe3+-hydroxamate transport system substrate-binding protein
MIQTLPGVLYPDRESPRKAALARSRKLLAEIRDSLKPPQAPLWRGSTLLISDADPVLAFGDGTYLGDILQRLGGTNAVTDKAWVELSLEDVLRLDPEAIVIVRDHGPVDALEAAGPLASLDIAARRNDRITALVHVDALLPSSAITGVAVAFRQILADLGEPR